MIFGAIGYSNLGKSPIFQDVEIMMISDQHDEPSTSCKSDDGKIIPSILISDYLRKLILNGYILLLEEIPYSGNLVGLWEDSIHVASTRQLYIDSLNYDKLRNKIIPFDIRLEIINNLDRNYSDNQILSHYIYNIYKFCIENSIIYYTNILYQLCIIYFIFWNKILDRKYSVFTIFILI